MSDKNLRELMEYLPENLKKYGLTLRAFKLLSSSCFGMFLDQGVGPDFKFNWERHHDNFIQNFEALEISEFPKFHILKKHVKQFIMMKRQSLGRYSEVTTLLLISLCQWLLKDF